MQFEKNSVIGFLLLALLFFGYFYFTRQGQLSSEQISKRIQDSVAALQPVIDTAAARIDSVNSAMRSQQTAAGQFVDAVAGQEEETKIDNGVLEVTFSNKGAQPKLVQLKNYKAQDSSLVTLVNSNHKDHISYPINTASNRTVQTNDLYFSKREQKTNTDGSQTIVYELADSTGQGLKHIFTLKPDDYMIDWQIEVTGAGSLLSQNGINLLWNNQVMQQEKDHVTEKRETQVGYWTKNDYDYFTLGRSYEKQFESPLRWLSVKQKFFNVALLASNNFNSANIQLTETSDTSNIITKSTASLKLNVEAEHIVKVPLQIYYGPNDYKLLKSYDLGMHNLINLGQGIYAFVKYINRYMVMPIFDFFSKFFTSYGIVIALLTMFIRLLTSPLVYSSYLSGAKMKAMRPELDILKQKHKDDQQAFAMEQMKLFRSAGVNPLGGCIPALLQIPIFFSLYSFFNAAIDLRGENFLWANDLSAYDSILDFGFNIPFYGSHISLFTLLATVTSLLISIYSMAQAPTQDNPMLKYMPYIFPVMLLGIFNSLPSALTWYYTVSNLFTLLLQFIIQNYIIDHKKILVQLEENKKKPKVKSKWQERMEQMQEQQRKMQDLKSKGKK